MVPDTQKLSDYLHQLSKHQSYKDIAERAGVSQGTISRAIAEESLWPRTVRQIGKALKGDTEFFFISTEKEKPRFNDFIGDRIAELDAQIKELQDERAYLVRLQPKWEEYGRS